MPDLTKVPAHVRRMVDDPESIAHWLSITDLERQNAYAHGLGDVRFCVAHERNGKLGQRGFYGRGAAFATAIEFAYQKVCAAKARDEREKTRLAELKREHDAYQQGFAVVNGKEWPLDECPQFIQDIAAKIADEYKVMRDMQ